MSVESIWRVLDEQVESGRFPGYVAAVRVGGEETVHAGGRMHVDADEPMREDTLFRIASVTKPIGAALTLSLIEDGVVALEDPVARWLPELGELAVLDSPDAPLDRTTPALEQLTLRHLLTFTCGWGAVFEDSPLQRAMFASGVYPGPLPHAMSGDEFVARLARLPLAFQPGRGWLYDTGMNLVGVLLARATGRPVSDLLAERITVPLGMTSTAFSAVDVARLATAYQRGPDGLDLFDPPDGAYAKPPEFEELSGGLVSSAPDLLRFFCAMADGGSPVLSADSLALMTTDALTDEQRRAGAPILDDGTSWGLGTGVDIEATQPWMSPGRWGWTGGTGTSAYVDPARDTVAVLLTQRLMTGPADGPEAFWSSVASARA